MRLPTFATMVVLGAVASVASAQSEPTADECFLTGDPDCPSPESDEASITAEIAQLHKLDSSCPALANDPGALVKDNAGNCVLAKDATLTETLDLASFTKLNCKGHKLTALAQGAGSVPSNPEVALLVNAAYGVTVQNCVLEKFDYGVLLLSSKTPDSLKDEGAIALTRSKFLHDVLTVRYQGFVADRIDNVQIADSAITFTADAGGGILLARDTDRIIITGNTITRASTARPTNVAPFFPSGSFGLPAAIGIRSSNLRAVPLITYKLGGSRSQSVYDAKLTSDDNIVEGNTFDLNWTGSVPAMNVVGISYTGSNERTLIRFNSVSNAGVGIDLGGAPASTTTIPGGCSGASWRCLSAEDCQLDDVDRGTCTNPAPTPTLIEVTDVGNVIEGNALRGPFSDSGITIRGASEKYLVVDNDITGSKGAGLSILRVPFGSGLITRNRISSNAYGLLFDPAPGTTSFAVGITLNDITGSVNRAIQTTAGYGLTTKLSVDGKGNYWERTCADSGAFREFGEVGADSPNALIVDEHPYGIPVADRDDASLPTTFAGGYCSATPE